MLRTELYKFQAEDRAAINRMGGRCLVANALGLGKTVTSLAYMDRYLRHEPGPTVVVVPAHLRVNWEREILKHLCRRAEILYGERVPPGRLKPHRTDGIFVLSYNSLVPPLWRGGAKLPPDSWAKFLLDLRPKLLIADEAQNLKSSRALRTRAVRTMSRSVDRVLLLTGTPLTNSPKDLWALLNILDPETYKNETEFCLRVCRAVRMWWGWQFKGAKDLDRLHLEIKPLMLRRRKEDVLHELPVVTHTVIPLEVDLAEYRRAESDFLSWLEEKTPGAARRARQAEELVKLNHLKQLAGLLKLDQIALWTEELLAETGGKLLLGAVHHKFTDGLLDRLGRKAIRVDGRMSAHEKQRAFDAFNNDKKTKVLIGNLQAAGTGWSCKSTSDVAVGELSWLPSELEQYVGRIDGIDRGIPGTAAHARFFTAAGTLDDDLCRLLQTKRSWAAQAVDGDGAAHGLDLFSQLKALMRDRHSHSKRARP